MSSIILDASTGSDLVVKEMVLNYDRNFINGAWEGNNYQYAAFNREPQIEFGDYV